MITGITDDAFSLPDMFLPGIDTAIKYQRLSHSRLIWSQTMVKNFVETLGPHCGMQMRLKAC